MKYAPRYDALSAVDVELDGAAITVVSAGGKAHCVPTEIFALFFRAVEDGIVITGAFLNSPGNAGITVTPSAVPDGPSPAMQLLYEMREPATPAPKPSANGQRTVLPLTPGLPKIEPPLKTAVQPEKLDKTQAILRAIGEAPRTGVEVADRALILIGRDPKDMSERAKVQSLIHWLGKNNRIVRRECPETHIDKWYLVNHSVIPKA